MVAASEVVVPEAVGKTSRDLLKVIVEVNAVNADGIGNEVVDDAIDLVPIRRRNAVALLPKIGERGKALVVRTVGRSHVKKVRLVERHECVLERCIVSGTLEVHASLTSCI